LFFDNCCDIIMRYGAFFTLMGHLGLNLLNCQSNCAAALVLLRQLAHR
jgi:hypothetical protein